MNKHYILTLLGKDDIGIVASVTDDLSQANCNLQETSMLRLGDSFSILMIIETELGKASIKEVLDKTCQQFKLKLHVDHLDSTQQSKPINSDVQVSIHGADSVGIVAKATNVLATAGLNITHLSSDIINTNDMPIYVLSISGQATQGYTALETAVKNLQSENLDVHIEPIQVLMA